MAQNMTGFEILNTKSEMLNNIKYRNLNDQNIKVLNFEFRYLNLFRIWCLGFRIFHTLLGTF